LSGPRPGIPDGCDLPKMHRDDQSAGPFRKFSGRVGGCVIDDDDLEWLVRSFGGETKGRQCAGQFVFLVVSRNNEREHTISGPRFA